MASQGDIRVLLVLDLLLSLAFSWMALTAMDVAGLTTFAWSRVALGALVIGAITYVVVLRE